MTNLSPELCPQTQTKRPHRRLGVPHNCTFWPARGIRCAICQDPLWWASPTQLKCQNARPGNGYTCWNQVLVPVPLLVQKLFPPLITLLGHHPSLLDNVIDVVWSEHPGTSFQGQRLIETTESQLSELDQQEKRLVAAIATIPDSAALVAQLASTESEVRRLSQLRDATRAKLARSGGWVSREDIAASLSDSMGELSKTSYSFGERLRSLLPDIVVHPVQALDSPQVRPRIVVRIPGDATPGTPRELVIDAFAPPDYIKHATECARFLAENPYLGTCDLIGEHLGLNRMTVSRALRYAEVMRQHHANDPYVVLTQPPKKASRWRKESLQQPDAA